MLKVAVIGVNNIGSIHTSVYRENRNVELVAVCDLLVDRADAAAKELGVKAYYSVADMLKSEQIDAVSVATAGFENGSHHYDPAMQAIEHGVHVLCEKPLSNDIELARVMVQRAKEKGVYLGCDLNHRFINAAYKGKHLVESGKLGSLLWINMKLAINNSNESSPWFHLRALHCHSIDVMRYFAGDVSRVQAFLTKAPGRETWSTASINMAFANGAVGHLTGSYDARGPHPIEYCEVSGTGGRFVIDNINDSFTFYPADSEETIVVKNTFMGVKSFTDTFRNRINRFVEQVSERCAMDEFEGSGAEALAAQEVVEAAIKSWQTNAIVEVPR